MEAQPAATAGTDSPPLAWLDLGASCAAALRALESALPSALFRDRLAIYLAGPTGYALLERLESVLSDSLWAHVAVRTRYFDDFLMEAAGAHGIRQFVILGAAADTRAYRLSWPAGTRLFEIDRPELLSHKEATVAAVGAQPACWSVPVALDTLIGLAAPLRKAGYDPTIPAVWVAEGVLARLDEAEVDRLLESVTAQTSAGSWMVADLLRRDYLSHRLVRPWVKLLEQCGLPWRHGVEEPVGLFERHGWQPNIKEALETAIAYGRPPAPSFGAGSLWFPGALLVTARRLA